MIMEMVSVCQASMSATKGRLSLAAKGAIGSPRLG